MQLVETKPFIFRLWPLHELLESPKLDSIGDRRLTIAEWATWAHAPDVGGQTLMIENADDPESSHLPLPTPERGQDLGTLDTQIEDPGIKHEWIAAA